MEQGHELGWGSKGTAGDTDLTDKVGCMRREELSCKIPNTGDWEPAPPAEPCTRAGLQGP